MKEPIHQVLFGTFALAATTVVSSAAISVGPTYIETWNPIPNNWNVSTAEWTSHTAAGTAATITTEADLYTAVNAIGHAALVAGSGFTSGTWNATTGEVSRNAAFRINTNAGGSQFIQSALGSGDSSAFSFLEARARNTTGFTMTSVHLSYDFAKFTPLTGVSPEALDIGYQLYYSTDTAGAAGTWLRVSDIASVNLSGVDTTGTTVGNAYQNFSTTLDFSGMGGLAPNTNFFLRWVDDDSTLDDRQYMMDNIAFIVPEPSAGLLAASAVAAFGFIRRRRGK